MKKKFTFLMAALLLLSGLTWAQTGTTISWNASEQGYENQQEITSVDFDNNVSGTFAKGTNSNAPKYFTSGSAIRCYGGNTITIASSDANLTTITITFGTSDGTNAITTNVGNYSDGTWTGYAESVTFTIGGTTGHRRIAGFTITYGGEAPTPTVATPTFSPAGGTYTEAQSVEISCTTEGATIYYTLNGEDPTTNSTAYSEAITIEETNTVKAFAVKEGFNNSPVASATYTITAPPQAQTFSRIVDHAVVAGQTYLIVDVASGRALTSANGSTNTPVAVAVTIENNKITTDNTNLQWTFEATEGGYIIHPLGSTTTWLYNTSGTSNTGVRVGTNENKVWTLDITDANKPNYHGFKHNSTGRYLGVYNNQEWRSYTSIASNIENTQIEVFVLGDAPALPPVISANNVDLAYDDEAGSIAYTIDNPVEDGVLTAEVTSSTIEDFDLGEVGDATILFTCSPNDDVTTARTAIVTLTYTYESRATVTKEVTVTQAVAPLVYTTIPALFAAATSTEQSVLVTFNGWVVTGVSTNGKYVFVTDGNGNGFVIYSSNSMADIYEVGNTLTGTVECTLKLNAGYARLTNVPSESLTIGTGGSVGFTEIEMADLAGVNTGALVQYESLTCSISGNNYFLSDGTTTLQLYNSLFAFEALQAGHTYNISGVYQQYNATKEILPRSADDIEEVVIVTPSITVNPAIINASAEGASGTLVVTYENIPDLITFDLAFCDAEGNELEGDDPDWINCEINVTAGNEDYTVSYTISANDGEARTAYFKVNTYDTPGNEEVYAIVTVNQDAYEAPVTTGTIVFGNNGTKINAASVTGNDSMGNTWTITTEGTTSFTQNAEYSQVGKSAEPATSITFTTTLPQTATITAFSAKFGGFNSTAGDVSLKVGETVVGTGSLNGTNDVIVENTTMEAGTILTVTVTNIAKGVKCYYISYTISTDPTISADNIDIDYNVTSGTIAYEIFNPVEGGILTASVSDGSWITLGTIGENVPFTCTANTAYTARTAIVTLTYTYGEGTVTKDVTITQGAVPEPSFTLAPEAVNVSADGGQCAVVFTLANVSGTMVAINTYFDPGQPEWIPNNGGINYTTLANIYLSPLEMDSIYMDSIYITVEQNNTNVSRSVEIWMSIMISGSYTQIASNRVTITQAAPETPHYTWDLTTNSYASASADSVIWSSDYAMMIIEKHQSSTAANNYLGGGNNNQTRFYKDQKLTFTPNSGYAVDSIVINATSGEGFTGNSWTNATASASGSVITVVPTDGDEPFSVVISKACHTTGVTVYYRTSTTNVYYNITLSYGEHGILTSDKTTAREGDTVIIAVIPDEYYYASAFGFAICTGASLDYVEIEPNVYRVIMPACDLSVSATFATYYDLYTITIDEDIENGTVVADKVEAPENALITLTVTPAAGYILEDNNLVVVANTANVEVTKMNSTTYTFNMPAENVTVMAEFTAIPPTTYTRATYIQSGRHYIIVGFNGDDAYAMGQQNNYNRAAVAISVDGNVATVNSTDGVYEFVINDVAGVKKTPFANPTENVYVQRTIYDPASSGYLYAASSGSNYLKTETHLDANDNALWYVTQDYSTGIATVVAYGANTKNRMRYNSASNVFSCYGANNTQQDVYLYVKDEETPTFDFYKDVKGYGTSNGGYCLIAAPTNDAANPSVVGMITDDGSNPEGFTYDLYGFDFTQDQEWRNYRSAAFNMNNGQGYLYANKSSVTLHFQGAPYTNNPSQGGGTWFGSLSKEVTLQFDENNNHTFNGFNLVGNPLSIFAGVDRDFYVMNVDGTEVELAERAYVNPMEGVFVKATEANQIVLFEEWIQPDEWGFDDLGVRVSGDNGSSDFARIRFGEGRNLEKFMLNQNHTKLYFTQGNRDFAVVRSANEGEMPLNFKAETNGNYTISVNAENVEMNYLHLIDNMTGADVDLLATPSYSFEANTNDYATRFRLVFKANANVPENADADTFAFFNGNEWVVSNIGEATLQVVDVMGRVLSSETINGNAEISIKQEPGVYMLRLINGDNVKTQKVVVR